MNRSNKGFGLAGVFATVIFLIVAAIFSASAKSANASHVVVDSALATSIAPVETTNPCASY